MPSRKYKQNISRLRENYSWRMRKFNASWKNLIRSWTIPSENRHQHKQKWDSWKNKCVFLGMELTFYPGKRMSKKRSKKKNTKSKIYAQKHQKWNKNAILIVLKSPLLRGNYWSGSMSCRMLSRRRMWRLMMRGWGRRWRSWGVGVRDSWGSSVNWSAQSTPNTTWP